MSNGYDKYREAQIEDGRLYQDFVVDVAWSAGLAICQYASKAYQFGVGESRGGVEIKHDKKYCETGNLCMEVAEKAKPRPGPYVRSGVMKPDHWLFAIGDYDTVFFFCSNILRAMYLSNRYRTYETPTSQGFLLPDEDSQKYSALILRPNASGTVSQLVTDVASLAKELHKVAKANPKQMSLLFMQE